MRQTPVIYLRRNLNGLQAKKAVYMQRGWQQQIKNEHWQFFNSIQDTFTFTIYKAATESLHDIPFDEIQFEPLWKYYRANPILSTGSCCIQKMTFDSSDIDIKYVISPPLSLTLRLSYRNTLK